MADHESFALLLLRQIVGAHRALRQAEAGPAGDREGSVQAARQRLSQLVHQAAVQFPSPQDGSPGEAAQAARH